jgi:hypothetical protein
VNCRICGIPMDQEGYDVCPGCRISMVAGHLNHPVEAVHRHIGITRKRGAPVEEVPQYRHDCGACRFLGHYKDSDLYYCDQWSELPTVIARWGSDGWQYQSGLEFGRAMTQVKPNSPMAVAYMRARRAGLV